MTTEYTHRVTIATPESMIEKSNHLAVIMGESASDMNTFSTADYKNGNGDKYAVCSTVVTSTFISGASSGELPPSPPHAAAANRAWAAEVYASLGADGGLMMIVDSDAQAAIAIMGLSRNEDDA